MSSVYRYKEETFRIVGLPSPASLTSSVHCQDKAEREQRIEVPSLDGQTRMQGTRGAPRTSNRSRSKNNSKARRDTPNPEPRKPSSRMSSVKAEAFRILGLTNPTPVRVLCTAKIRQGHSESWASHTQLPYEFGPPRQGRETFRILGPTNPARV